MTNRKVQVPRLTGGISQMDPSQRRPDQLESSVNAWPSLIEGLSRRNSTSHVARISTDEVSSDARFHITKQGGVDYLVHAAPDTLQVFDTDGTEYDIYWNVPSSGLALNLNTAYLSNSTDNPIANPEEIGTGYWVTNVVTTAGSAVDATVGPLGVGFAYKLSIENTPNDGIWAQEVVTWLLGSLVFSVYVKEDDSLPTIDLLLTNQTAGVLTYQATFVWSASVLTTSGSPTNGATSGVDSVGGGWYRAWIQIDAGVATSANVGDQIGYSANSTQIILGDSGSNGDGDLFWGAKIETSEETLSGPGDYDRDFGPLKFLSISDSTFILNTAQTPRMGGPKTEALEEELNTALIFVRLSSPTIGDTYYATITTENPSATDSFSYSTLAANEPPSVIAAGLAAQINASAKFSATVVNGRSTIVVTALTSGGSPDRTITQVDVGGPDSDLAIVSVFDSVPDLSDLPTWAPQDYRVGVSGDASTNSDDYFVQFETNAGLSAGSEGEGAWAEAEGFDVLTGLDASSMPHELKRQVDTDGSVTGTPGKIYFVFQEVDWTAREVGDDVSNLRPSFIGTPIHDIYFFQGRMGFLTDRTVVMSETNSFFNFWRTTVVQVPDSDRIDVATNETEPTFLRNAVLATERLLAFSDRAMFVMNTDPTAPATPRNSALVKALAVRSDTSVRPVASGLSVFVPSPRPYGIGLFEVRPLGDGLIYDSADASREVPALISESPTHLSALDREGAVFVVSAGQVFFYKYEWSGNNLVQAAWGEFRLNSDATLLFAGARQTDLVLAVRRSDGLYLETLEVGDGVQDDSSTFHLRMDRRVTDSGLTRSYAALDDATTITLPYDVRSGIAVDEYAVTTRPDGLRLNIESIDTTTPGSHQVVVTGDHSADSLWLGEVFETRIGLTEPVVQDTNGNQAGGDYRPMGLSLRYSKCGDFTTEVTPFCLETFSQDFSAQAVGGCDAESENVELVSGTEVVGIYSPARGLAVEVISDDVLPMTLVRALWDGDLSPYEVHL